jgi:stage V sporulation protein D (sporulation-specific penicillin-binding protein)
VAGREYRDKVIIKRRMLIVFGMLSVLFFSLTLRLVHLMVIESDRLKGMAVEQWTSEVRIEARRGRILDRNGVELALSANVYRVDLDMNTLRQYLRRNNQTYEDIAPVLAAPLNMDSKRVLNILNRKLPSGADMQSATLARRVEKTEADNIRKLEIRGVIVSPDTKRYYPNNNFLAHVLGVVDADGKGLTGVELQYNSILSGIPGVRITETDRRSEELPYIISEFTKPIDGRDVVLTIDEQIQLIAEKAAQQALSDNKASAVSIVAMDPKTGEILALVNKPDFNPNSPREGAETFEELQKMWRNRAVNDTYEPGSIFKVITAIAAMEKGLVQENDEFHCTGHLTIGGRNIHCWRTSGHGTQNFVDILKNSCNVGFMIIADRLQRENLNEYINRFGFGHRTGIDLPGEAKGIVKRTENITTVDLATISFGQSNTVTPIQFLAAFNAIVNGGEWITPHIMKEITYVDDNNRLIVEGKFETTNKNYTRKQVVNKEHADALKGYLEKVVSEGGGHKAFIEGYRIGGKTGTAQKVNPSSGAYQPGKYVASFAGMAPADDPRITLFISIDEPDPSNYYAGQIAAPVAQQVFNDIFNYLELKADASDESVARSLLKDVVIPNVRGLKRDEAVKILRQNNIQYEFDGSGEYVVDMNPKPGYTVKEGTRIIAYTGSGLNYNRDVVVPNLKGYSKSRAEELLGSLGLKASFSGEGLVVDQSYSPKEIVTKGTEIRLFLNNAIGD